MSGATWGASFHERLSIMTFKDKLIIYLHNKSSKLDDDYTENSAYYRYRKPDEVDYLELIIRKVRKDLFNEIVQDIMLILNTSKK